MTSRVSILTIATILCNIVYYVFWSFVHNSCLIGKCIDLGNYSIIVAILHYSCNLLTAYRGFMTYQKSMLSFYLHLYWALCLEGNLYRIYGFNFGSNSFDFLLWLIVAPIYALVFRFFAPFVFF